MKKLPKAIRYEFHLSYDGDAWGRVMQWRFALADYLTHRGRYVPHFRQAPMGPDRSDYVWKFLAKRNDALPTLEKLHACLERLADILREQGKDY